jgi:Tol biopolymer transport system component
LAAWSRTRPGSRSEAASPSRPSQSQNGAIAFSGNLDGEQAFEIFKISPEGTNLRSVNFPPIYNLNPAFSPDGTRLAADNNAEEEASGEILLANADGSQMVNLTKSPRSNETDPAWFPSGRRLVYCGAPIHNPGGISFDEFELYALSFDRQGNITGSRQLTRNTAYDCEPAVSLDRSMIAFTHGQEKHSEIVVMRRSGGRAGRNNRPVKLTDNSVRDYSPDWSPDSRKIVYGRANSIWIMNPDGSGKKRLGSGHYPAFSPDGKSIAFVDTDADGTPSIWKMSADGKGRIKLTGNGYRGFSWFQVFHPDWQPRP